MELADSRPESCLVANDGGNSEQEVKGGYWGVQVVWEAAN
jgi:hypothetical protein